jgi:hypothetical protein
VSEASRNAPCHCGSGKRFKHCHGREAAAPVPTRFQALAAHQAGQLGRAEALYRRALEENAVDVDALHMLGVVQLQRMRYRESLDLLWDAAERSNWSQREVRHNVGIVLGKLVTRDANVRQAELLEQFVALERARRASRVSVAPLVTVALPAFNHARYVAEALASVAAQTYRNLELVVIDDGSSDGTPAAIENALRGFPFPARFVARGNRGAPATLNEAAAMARGDYVAFLNSDDLYAPDRIESLVADVGGPGAAWGFTLVSGFRDGAAPGATADADDILQRQRQFMGTQPHGFTLVEYNVAISSGNLFVERRFFERIGGFRDYRYNHDWDFCLRACADVEPAVVYRPLYRYGRTRRHDQRVEGRLGRRRRPTSSAISWPPCSTAARRGPIRSRRTRSRIARCSTRWRSGRDQGAIVPAPILRGLVGAVARRRQRRTDSGGCRRIIGRASRADRVALVVLGMHRSGTSAMARVLNLCGAFLPEKVKPRKIGVNPKGFWEPEAVLELNVRVMTQLGGDWDRIDFPLPDTGDVVDEFDADARALLATEYGDAPTIVVKDPRMCVLAPLWHRAMAAAGYRPAYVVPLRTRSKWRARLHARGDMSVAAASRCGSRTCGASSRSPRGATTSCS